MKKYQLFVGVDVSKHWIDVAIIIDGKLRSIKHRQFKNTPKGFEQLYAWLQKTGTTLWIVCMEHTGIYTLPLTTYLGSKSIDFVLESGLQIKRSLGIKRGKSDKADAKDIARYVYVHREELVISELPSQTLAEMKNLLSHRQRLVKQKVQLQNACTELKAFGAKHPANQYIIQDSVEQIQEKKARIKKIEKMLMALIKGDERIHTLYKLVSSVKGVALITTTHLIVHTNCFTAFSSWRKFAAYIGTAPFTQQSGKSLNKRAKVSKLAHKKLKALLSNCIFSAIQHDKQLAEYFNKKRKQGKCKYKVYNAVKNKLLSRIFAVVKRGTPYVELANYK